MLCDRRSGVIGVIVLVSFRFVFYWEALRAVGRYLDLVNRQEGREV